MNSYPKIAKVTPLSHYNLLVTFQNGVQKQYDCSSLLEEEPFKPLVNNSLFDQVEVAFGGYGILWNDEIDLSEAELWLQGIEIATSDSVFAHG